VRGRLPQTLNFDRIALTHTVLIIAAKMMPQCRRCRWTSLLTIFFLFESLVVTKQFYESAIFSPMKYSEFIFQDGTCPLKALCNKTAH
jgi:hypothetical protein